jgi:hypothetical protein
MTSIQSAGFALIISVILLLIGAFTGIDTPPSSTFSYQLNVNGLLNTLATILPVPPWPTTGIYDSYFPPFQSLYLRTGLAGITIFFFIRCIQFLSPGAKQRSRLLFAGLLASAPIFSFSVFLHNTLVTALCLLFIVIGLSVKSIERKDTVSAIFATIISFMLFLLVPSLLLLLTPLLLNAFWTLRLKKPKVIVIVALLIIALFALESMVLYTSGWSLNHYRSTGNSFANYPIPNALFTLLLLINPLFLITLPLLGLLAKRTDLYLPEKRALLIGIILYTIWLNGLPNLELILMLPLWTTILLLAFPAWDRFVTYGLYFTRKITITVLSVLFAIQIVASIFLNPW